MVCLYLPSVRNGFIYDDQTLIVDQPTPESIGDLAVIFAEPHFPDLPYYRPVTRLTLVGQKFLHGNRPGPFHLFNSVLIGITALIGYALLRLPVFGIARVPALLASAAFAFHPIASSCVYPISSGRETLLPTMVALMAIYAFLRSGRGWHLISMIAFTVALFGKEQAIIIPAIFVLADISHLSAEPPGKSFSRWVSRYGPIIPVVIFYLFIRHRLFGGGEYTITAFDDPVRPLSSFMFGLQVLVAPFRQLVYEPPLDIWFSIPRLLAAGMVTATLIFLLVKQSSTRKKILFWAGWFVISQLPTANLIRQEALYDERYVFLASLAFWGATAICISIHWGRPWVRFSTALVGGMVLVCLAGITVFRGSFFKTDEAFYRQWVRTNPRAAGAHINLGLITADKGQIDQAIRHYRTAIEIKPHDSLAHTNLGLALVEKGEIDQAIDHYRIALEIEPNFSSAQINLGSALVEKGEIDQAIDHYRTAIEIDPKNVLAYIHIANALVRTGELDQAIGYYRTAIELDPNNPNPHINLGNTFLGKGKNDQAAYHYQIALRIDPANLLAHFNLGNVLLQAGNIEEAINHYRAALAVDPEQPLVLEKLSLAQEMADKKSPGKP